LLAFDAQSSNAALRQLIDKRFPEQASSFIESHRIEGPLYNSYNWGGYLIWRLPLLPVSIDGRANLYEERLAEAVNTAGGAGTWSQDAALKHAATILLERDGPLASILRVDPAYRLIYEDSVASVFQPAVSALR
jgi:hypothetical protein